MTAECLNKVRTRAKKDRCYMDKQTNKTTDWVIGNRWYYGVVLVPLSWATTTSVKAPLMLKGTNRRTTNMLSSFSGIIPATQSNHILFVWNEHQTDLLQPDLSHFENVWHFMEHKITQVRPRIIEQLQLLYKAKMGQNSTLKCQQQFPRFPNTWKEL